MRETWIPPQGQEDPVEEGMATHSSILACRISWTEEPDELFSVTNYSPWGRTEPDTTEGLN